MANYLKVQAERSNGLCVLRITGDLDMSMADVFADHVDAVVRAMPGPVQIDLSGLRFIDEHGARALVAVIRILLAGRLTAIRPCPPHVRRVLELPGLSADYALTGDWTAPEAETCHLVDRLRRARLDASEAMLEARGMLSRLTDTCIRLASTRERTGLMLEQGRRTVANSRVARENVRRTRREAAA